MEVIALAAQACEAVGLTRYTIELGQVRIGQAALAAVTPSARSEVAGALGRKDVGLLARLLEKAGVPARDRRRLEALANLYGDLGVLRQAKRLLRTDATRSALAELSEVAARLEALGLGPRLAVDLGEVRGQAYYTGVSFTVLADGPGEPVGQGGRYDQLLERFGMPAPATGLALDLDNLEWALSRETGPYAPSTPPRVAIAGPAGDARLDRLAAELRERGVCVAHIGVKDLAGALAFAHAWRYDAALVFGRGKVRVERTEDGARRGIGPDAVDTLVAFIAARTNEEA